MMSQKTPPAYLEYATKWRGCLAENLFKISHQVNPPDFTIEPGALNYVEQMLVALLFRLLDARPSNVADLEIFVRQNFPTPLNFWATDSVRRVMAVGRQVSGGRQAAKEKPAFQVQKIQAILKEVLNYRPDTQVLTYALAVLEFIAADILKLTGRYVKNMRHNVITFQDLKVSLTADSVLMDLFFRDGDDTWDTSSPHSFLNGPQSDGQQKRLNGTKFVDHSSTYEQMVKDLIYDETQYLRDLNMLILVFRNAFEKMNDGGVNKAVGASSAKLGASNAAYDNFSTNLYENEMVRLQDTTGKEIVDLDKIFSNAVDVRDFTLKFLALLEDTVEMSRDNKQPSVGTCFSEMAQAYEFDVYHKYIEDVMNATSLDYLFSLLARDKIVRKHLRKIQTGFELAVKYVLPRLLLIPILHCSKYFDYLTNLNKLSKSKDDSTDLLDAESLLIMLRKRIELHSADLMRRNISGQFQLRFVPCGQNQLALAKMYELVKQVDGFDTKADGKNASEFILEGILGKYHMLQPKLGNTLLGATDTLRTKVSRTTERYVFLFDTIIVLCKPLSAAQIKKSREISNMAAASGNQTTISQSANNGSNSVEFFKFKFKECFQIRRIEILDRDDTEDLKNAFEIRPRSGHTISQAFGPVLLFTKTSEEKQIWMASLIMLQTRSMLERMLDASLVEEENRIPLYLPSVEQYRFAEKDSEDNIMFEDYVSSSGLPIVRGATLPKLIERLTPNQHADPIFCKMFLMTYRSFCEQRELLNLLIERFHIPDPSIFFESGGECLSTSGPFTSSGETVPPDQKLTGSPTTDCDPLAREIMKKFRKNYAQPVQIRVLNVIRHWVDDHWYDFNQDQELLISLKQFLINAENLNYKHITKWAKNIREIVARKEEAAMFRENFAKEFHFISEPPPVEWHLTQDPSQFDLMTVHPVEIARQVTLLEFELYRAVKPFELVDASFTKKDKSRRSPQLTKLVKHSTHFTYWLETCIVDSKNLDERVAVVNRILEIMCVFDELNNFNGLIEIYGALLSAAIDRLLLTWEKVDKYLLKKFNEVKQLYADPRHRNVRLKLKSINPPCVPYFGTYLTSLTYLNENKTFLQTNAVSLQADANNHPQEGLPDTASIITVEENLSSILDNNPQLVNVAKCRKIHEIIGEIQLYQDQAYCLRVEPSIRNFFETLNPLQKFNDNANDLQTYLYDCSLKIEPKNVDRAPYFQPTRDILTLKSPGIKLSKGGKAKHLSATAPPSSIFTPLHRLGKEKPTPLNPSLPSSLQANTPTAAPASPSSSKDAPFSIIDIEPGKPLRYIRDVHHTSTQGSSPKDGVGSSPTPPPTMPRGVTSSLASSRTVARANPLTDPAPTPIVPPRPRPMPSSSTLVMTSSTTTMTSSMPSSMMTSKSSTFPSSSAVVGVGVQSPPRLPPKNRQHQQASRFNFPDIRTLEITSSNLASNSWLPRTPHSPLTVDGVGVAATGVLSPPRVPPRRVGHLTAPDGDLSRVVGTSLTVPIDTAATAPSTDRVVISSSTPLTNDATLAPSSDDAGMTVIPSTSSTATTLAPPVATLTPPFIDDVILPPVPSVDATRAPFSNCIIDEVFSCTQRPTSASSVTPPPLPPRSQCAKRASPPPRPPKKLNQWQANASSILAVAPPPLPPKTYRPKNSLVL